ncbi:MAG: DUF4411 family protein [Novosphingobium sp.]
MAGSAPVYCIDTSSLLHAWQRAYPFNRFPKLWAQIDSLIEDGRLIASIEVYHELKQKDDDVYAWAKERKDDLIREIDEDSQDAVSHIMAAYPRLVDTVKGKSGADPFVIALAKCPPPSIVVTQEGFGSMKSPKIPYVCQQEGITCMNLLELIEAEDWVF